MENTIVAPDATHPVGSNVQQGAIYVFAKPSTGWTSSTETAELTVADGMAYDQFGGIGVAVSDDGSVTEACYP